MDSSDSSLAILWCGGQAVLSGPAGAAVRTGLVPAADAGAEILRVWREEFPQVTAARLFTEPEDPLAGAAATLFADAARKEKRRLEGAWPLAALLGIAPTPLPSIEIVAIGSIAALRFAPASGEAWLRCLGGPKLAEAALGEIHEALARVEEGSSVHALLVAESCPAAGAIRDALAQARGPEGRGFECAEIPFEAFLDRARSLSPGGPGDLLAGRRGGFRSPGRRWLIAARLALLACAGAGYLHRRYRLQAAEAARAAESLWRESAAARERNRFDALRSAARPFRPSLSEFLGALAAATPPSAVLESLRIDGSGFQVRGRALPSAQEGGAAPEALRRALFAPGSLWSEQPAPSAAAGEFALGGAFVRSDPTPAAPDAPPAQPLLSAENFPSRLAEWAPAWRVEPESGDQADGRFGFETSTLRHRPRDEAENGLVSRRFVLTPIDLGPSAWPALLGLARKLSSVPGLSVDRLEVEGAPKSDGSFTRMELVLTARLRRRSAVPGGASSRRRPRPRRRRAH